MDSRAMKRLCELCEDELEQIISKGELSMSTLEQAHKLTDTIKNVKKIEMLDGGDGYSRNSSGQSYARDAYGRYSRDDGYSYEAYDGTQGSRRSEPYQMYSRHTGKEKLMEQINAMMQDASEREKDTLRRFREELKNM